MLFWNVSILSSCASYWLRTFSVRGALIQTLGMLAAHEHATVGRSLSYTRGTQSFNPKLCTQHSRRDRAMARR